MVKAEDELAAEVASWLDKATEADTTEDAEHGPDQRGDETPDSSCTSHKGAAVNGGCGLAAGYASKTK